MSDKLFNAITQQKEQTEQAVQPLYGSLGIPLGGQKLVEVPNRKSFVYVRLRDNQSEVIQAFNNKVAPSYNLPVVIVREGNRYIVSGVDTQRYQNNWVSYAPYLPRHGNTHSFDTDNGGAGDVVFVHGRQFLPLLVFPSGTLGGPNAMVSPHVLESVSGTWMYVGNTGTQNLLQYVPTGSNAVMILVYLNRVTGNPGIIVNSGSYFSNTITGTAAVTPFIPAVINPMTDIPIGAIRLTSGTSIINWNNIYEVRQFNQFIATGSLGSTIFIQDEGIPRGIASVLNFVGPNVDVTISGSTARIFVTGSTGGGSVPTLLSGSIALADSAGVLTSRPWLKYEDADEAIQFGANKIRWGGNAGKIYYADYMYILGGGEAFPRVTVMHDDVYISNSLTTRYISGSVMLLDGAGLTPLGIRNNNIDIFHVNTSGTAYSNNVPLIKEAPINSNTYGRKNAGWEVIQNVNSSLTPGGRLTFATGTPCPTNTATGTTLWYLPYVNNMIPLWNGSEWMPTTFTDPSLALSGMVTGTGYDIFGFLNAGTLALETQAWTNSSVRSIGITYQDGRLCKANNKTRLYLGSLYPVSATLGEDSQRRRYLFNMYNRKARAMIIENGSVHSYNTAVARPFNGSLINSEVEMFIGTVEDTINAALSAQMTRDSTDGNPRISLGINSASVEFGAYGLAVGNGLVGRVRGGSTADVTPNLGYNFISILEFSTAGSTAASFESASLNAMVFD